MTIIFGNCSIVSLNVLLRPYKYSLEYNNCIENKAEWSTVDELCGIDILVLN
jgi:hypothetical protein